MVIAQREALYRHRIPEPSCARKETVDIDILVTSRIGERKIMLQISNFSSRADPSIFLSITPVLLDRSNETRQVFPALKSASHFLP